MLQHAAGGGMRLLRKMQQASNQLAGAGLLPASPASSSGTAGAPPGATRGAAAAMGGAGAVPIPLVL